MRPLSFKTLEMAGYYTVDGVSFVLRVMDSPTAGRFRSQLLGSREGASERWADEEQAHNDRHHGVSRDLLAQRSRISVGRHASR